MRTKSVNKSEINHDWWVADAEDQTLGRFASRIAQVLRGKHKPQFTPHMDMGDFVIVVNAEKIRVSGNKEIDKTYFKHSGYPGGGSTKNLKFMRKTYPKRVIENDKVIPSKYIPSVIIIASYGCDELIPILMIEKFSGTRCVH